MTHIVRASAASSRTSDPKTCDLSALLVCVKPGAPIAKHAAAKRASWVKSNGMSADVSSVSIVTKNPRKTASSNPTIVIRLSAPGDTLVVL